MQKETAEKNLQTAVNKQLSKFCPIARERCRTDCECFENGVLSNFEEEGQPDNWYYRTPYCSCYMLHGA